MTLVFCSDGKYAGDGSCENSSRVTKPTINTTYFPSTHHYTSWTSTPDSADNDFAWYVTFGSGHNSGYSFNGYKTSNYSVRLVRR
jgi:hypothetical protein